MWARRLHDAVALQHFLFGDEPFGPGFLLIRLRPARCTRDHAVQEDGAATGRVVEAQPGCDRRAPVATLCHVSVIAQHLRHQLRVVTRHGARTQGAVGLAREPEADQRGRDDVEGILGLAAEPFRMGERFDDFHELDDAARPAMGDQQRHRRRAAPLFVQEVDVDAVHGRDEMIEAVDRRFLLSPVEFVQPVCGELLHIVEIGAVAPAAVVGHFMPWKALDPAADVGQRLVGHLNLEGPAGGKSFVDHAQFQPRSTF